jgi:hypothetical protein
MTPKALTIPERRVIDRLLFIVVESNTIAPGGATPAEMVEYIPKDEADRLGRDMMALLRKTFKS